MNNVRRVVRSLEKEGRAVAQRITKKRLVDTLNYVNFRTESIIINLEHSQYGTAASLRAYPEPCSGDLLRCLWVEGGPAIIATSYVFRSFMVDRGLDLLLVEAQEAEVSDRGIEIVLPQHCRAVQTRKTRRHACEGVKVSLTQNGAVFSGVLDDFAALSFRVLVAPQPPHTFEWIDEEELLYAVFSRGSSMIYSGECRIVRYTDSKGERAFVLEPVHGEKGKSRRDRLNSTGHALVPRPNVIFDHPLIGKRMSLEVDEASFCWFSVTENYDNSVLFPGLLLAKVDLEIAPGFSVTCSVQVSSGDVRESNATKTVTWWFVVLDMSIDDQGRLFALLQRASHQRSHASVKMDLDELLTFFFDTGFVYPKKYAALQLNKDQFRETYKKLYLENPAIVRHFIQPGEGGIFGHLSMIRFYQNTWIIQHHAAAGQHAAGLAVLNQVRDYVNDYRYLCSSHMDFLVCYFRPANRFPNRVFGGFARALDDPEQCSIDSFAYFNFRFDRHDEDGKRSFWHLDAAKPEDLAEFSRFYESVSGGLMVRALDLTPDSMETDSLDEEYERLGFKRKRHLFSLKRDGVLKAVIVAVVSDMGLNMSNLTNCIHVFVLDPEDLPVEELTRNLLPLGPHYAEDEIPVLLYPLSYAESQAISYEKAYNLWAFDTRHTGRFYEYMGEMLGRKNGVEKDERIVRDAV